MEDDKKISPKEINFKMTVLNDEALGDVSGGVMVYAPFCYYYAVCLEPGCGWKSSRHACQTQYDKAGTVAKAMAEANEHGYATGHFEFEIMQIYPCDV